jgi:hypothetical protein
LSPRTRFEAIGTGDSEPRAALIEPMNRRADFLSVRRWLDDASLGRGEVGRGRGSTGSVADKGDVARPLGPDERTGRAGPLHSSRTI